ncbi:MAG TPA: sigma-70 family RNA polymerase sigma factor [Phototrophicaceae bacterium]|nr:sigma-70 family RNA polymerase sigma factor [Phototrophicaceae bacterium]
MDDNQQLAEQFEANREHLQAVAYRMLGSLPEANDAVQEAWLRLNHSDANRIDNMGGWLTTVVAHICLDHLRARKAQRESPLDESADDTLPSHEQESDPEQEALLADSVGLALLVILDTLNPAERLAFVLHDIFAMPFEAIAPIVERSEPATRKLVSRARHRVQGAEMVRDANLTYQRDLVNAFLQAAREGSFDTLLAVLDPDVVFHVEHTAVAPGWPREAHGAADVANLFSGSAQVARTALIDGVIGVVVPWQGKVAFVFNVTVKDGKITEIEVTGDPERIAQMEIFILDK